MTDGSDAVSYGLNGEKLVCKISRFHDAKINASCLKITIEHPGRKKALIRTVAIVTAIFTALYFLSKVRAIVHYACRKFLGYIAATFSDNSNCSISQFDCIVVCNCGWQ